MNDAAYGPDFDPAASESRVNRWIVSQLAQLEPRVKAAIEGYRFNEAAQAYNTRRRGFPTRIVAGFFDFGEAAYFEAEEGAETAPEVDFSR